MVVPSRSRAASVALSRLIAGIVTIPAAQFVGFISDALRGESTMPEDKFHAYQIALLFASSFSIANAIFDKILIIFFPGDCEKAAEMG
ncbi:hypothetical protein PMAYCL1PPCAC_22511, partial [Pristionchus mayeri]